MYIKKCFKCGEERPLSDFYKHCMMADGHLSKCKECTKRDAAERIERKKHDPDWRDKERARCREKQRRMRLAGKEPRPSAEVRRRYQEKNRHKTRARQITRRAIKAGRIPVPETCQACREKQDRIECHHLDYDQPMVVLFLCTRCHGLVHRKSPDDPMTRG